MKVAEIEYGRRCCKLTRLERLSNDEIKRRLAYIEEKRFLSYEHVRRLDANRWTNKISWVKEKNTSLKILNEAMERAGLEEVQ